MRAVDGITVFWLVLFCGIAGVLTALIGGAGF
jgi:hypothetical protein